MDYATEEEIREEYDGQNLAFIARWEPAAGSRAYASTKAFMDHQDQKLWTEAKPVLFSTTGIAGALLDELKAIVQNRMSTRADECVADLGGLGGPLAEVILDIQAQATSLPPALGGIFGAGSCSLCRPLECGLSHQSTVVQPPFLFHGAARHE